MLPQTNLQLYRLMIQGNADGEPLARVRAAYDVARQLFAGAFRPSHKPFLCHLVGTAGALAGWGQPVHVTITGLLHSAYLYGQFNDGAKGATLERRNWLRRIIGVDAEELVFVYTQTCWQHRTAAGLMEDIETDPPLRQVTTIKLADLLDEFSDNGTLYSPAKALEFRLHEGIIRQEEILPLVSRCAGPRAEEQFREVFAALNEIHPPDCLRNDDRSFHFIEAGVPELARSPIGRMLTRFQRRVFQSRAA